MGCEDPEASKQEQNPSDGISAKKGRLAWLMEISLETAAIMNDGRTSKELMDELYDEETGLPK